MFPKLSIIVPVYNVENYLVKCLQSILNQTFDDFELILINDGSVDNSGVICDEFEKKDSRIKVVHKKNKGLASARNTGLKIARGEFIGFVDSDDWVDPDMYKLLYESCINEGADFSIIGLREVGEDGKNLKEYVPNNITFSELLKRAYPCNKIIKRDLFIKNDLFFSVGRYYEDLELIPKLFIKATKVTTVKKVAYNYLQRSGSITQSRDEKILDNLWAYIQLKDFLMEEKLFKTYYLEFVKGVEYFKIYYGNILYDYPTRFLLKYSFNIIKNFNKIGGIDAIDFFKFIVKHLNYSFKKTVLIKINKIRRVLR